MLKYAAMYNVQTAIGYTPRVMGRAIYYSSAYNNYIITLNDQSTHNKLHKTSTCTCIYNIYFGKLRNIMQLTCYLSYLIKMLTTVTTNY